MATKKTKSTKSIKSAPALRDAAQYIDSAGVKLNAASDLIIEANKDGDILSARNLLNNTEYVGSGGGLPEITSNDAGKVLTVVPKTIQSIIVPEQNITLTQMQQFWTSPLTNVTASMYDFSDGQEVSLELTVQGEKGTIPLKWIASDDIFVNAETIEDSTILISITPATQEWMIGFKDELSEATVKLAGGIVARKEEELFGAQTLILNGSDPAEIQNANKNYFTEGAIITATINGESETAIVKKIQESSAEVLLAEFTDCAIAMEAGSMFFNADAGTYEISATAGVPILEPNWKATDSSESTNNRVVIECTGSSSSAGSVWTYPSGVTADQIYADVENGKDVYISANTWYKFDGYQFFGHNIEGAGGSTNYIIFYEAQARPAGFTITRRYEVRATVTSVN